ncbi:MAG TPA: enoyl-CoA hydratase-related protein, partial [Candidatus Binatus sp.]|nr:enoyl-CoA hydratase-related protein [Candidatus Binatus sp.]
AALAEVEGDPAIRAVVLTGAGRAFCAGQDLKERLEPDAPSLGDELRQRYNPIVTAIRTLPKPVLGAVNGVAAGAGAALAFACDLRVASEAATFVLAFGRIGLIPDTGTTWLLPRLIGLPRAMTMALLNEPLSATEAARIGLVAKVVPPEDLAAEAAELARRLAEAAPLGVAFTKRALLEAQDLDFLGALEQEASLQDVAGRTADHREGMAAFLEKREPRFRGE